MALCGAGFWTWQLLHKRQRLTWLGPPESYRSEAIDVSADGVVAGRFFASYGERAFRWENGIMQNLGTLPGWPHSWGWGISADGRVVVGDVTTGAGPKRAFRWESGVMQELGTLPSIPYSSGVDVSFDGSVIVGVAHYPFRAFRWVNGIIQDLGTLGGNESWARGVSANGQVIVGLSRNAQGWWRAFRWESGVMQDLGTLGGPQSSALGISADGLVVVGWAQDPQGQWRAFRWVNGVMQNLGTLPGQSVSLAAATSANGEIVVGWAYSYWEYDGRAFRWTPSGGLEDLNQTYAHLLQGGSILKSATSISPDGRYIVGWGYNAATGRSIEAYLLDTGVPGNRPPAVPTLIAPANGATVPPRPTFQLRASDPDGDRVRFEVELRQGNTVRTFYVPASGYVNSGQIASGTPLEDLSAGDWQWRARTWDSRWAVSSWSEQRSFRVVKLLDNAPGGSPAGVPNIAWGPLVTVSPQPPGWDSNRKRLVAGVKRGGVLYLAFSHDTRASDVLRISVSGVSLTTSGTYWVRADTISVTPVENDPLEIPDYVVLRKTGSNPTVCSIRSSACGVFDTNGRIQSNVEEFYAICLRVKFEGQRVPADPSEVGNYLRQLGQSNRIPPHLLWAIAWEETLPGQRWSHTRADGWSLLTSDGGIGLMQLTQETAVWGPRNIGDGWLPSDTIPNDLLTHLHKLASDWRYNARAGAAILKLPPPPVEDRNNCQVQTPIPRVLGTGADAMPYVLEHWWFRVWNYNGILCVNDAERCYEGPFYYPERIRFWLRETVCEQRRFTPVGSMGLPSFMRYASCNICIASAPTPYPANIDVNFDGVIDAKIRGSGESQDNLWDSNNCLRFWVDGSTVRWVRILSLNNRELHNHLGGGEVRWCPVSPEELIVIGQGGFIEVNVDSTVGSTIVKTKFPPAAHFWRAPGDVNGDGCTDDADLLAVLFAFGQSGADLPEDVNGDEVVDDADLLMVLFHFGSGC